MAENDRPQDVDRSHKRAGVPGPETAALLERYRDALRAELTLLLDELAPVPAVQTSMDGAGDKPITLGIVARTERWTLAMKVARELGSGIEVAAAGDATPNVPASNATRGRAPRLTKRDRAALG